MSVVKSCISQNIKKDIIIIIFSILETKQIDAKILRINDHHINIKQINHHIMP